MLLLLLLMKLSRIFVNDLLENIYAIKCDSLKFMPCDHSEFDSYDFREFSALFTRMNIECELL
jgi:hypothetical protein